MASVTEEYESPVQLTNLKDIFGTSGNIIVIEGDRAYSKQEVKDQKILNPKFWVYENIIKSARVQKDMEAHPNAPFIAGVGPSSFEGLHFHAQRNGRKLVVVVTKEWEPPAYAKAWNDTTIIHGDEPLEQGYRRKLDQVLRSYRRTPESGIFLNQALYGARAMAPIGNRIVSELQRLGVRPDATVWCLASGASLYGIGRKIAEHFPPDSLTGFPGTETVVVTKHTSLDPADLKDEQKVKAWARENRKEYSKPDPAERSELDELFFPLHVSAVNPYLLDLWEVTGKPGVDRVVKVDLAAFKEVQQRLRDTGHDWTNTTAMTLQPAVELARQGKNVLTMAYGSSRSLSRISS